MPQLDLYPQYPGILELTSAKVILSPETFPNETDIAIPVGKPKAGLKLTCATIGIPLGSATNAENASTLPRAIVAGLPLKSKLESPLIVAPLSPSAIVMAIPVTACRFPDSPQVSIPQASELQP